MFRYLTFIFLFTVLMSSCDGNSKSATQENAQENADSVENAPAQTQTQTQDHAGHDHDHDHDGHAHSEEPAAVENNSRTSVKVNPSRNPGAAGSAETPYRTKSQTNVDITENMQKSSRPVPDACSLVTDKFIAKVIGVDAMSINIKDGSNPTSPYARACFFRWDHRGVPNSGVLIQVSDNPVPDEFPEWASYYIQAKKNDGEKSPEGGLSYKYKDFTGLGVAGAYSYDLHRYMWRDKDDFVYMVAFNLPASEAEELQWARTLGAEVMRNVKS